MALRFNGNSPTGANPWSSSVGRTIGTASGVGLYTGARSLSALGGGRMAVHLSYGTAVGFPLGSTHPVSWAMPSVAGAIASRNNINGSSSVTSQPQSGRNIDAAVTGSGGVTSAPLGLIVSIAATLVASGGISAATANALASMVASITGSGSVSATAAGLAALGASLLGSGSMSANNTARMDLTATIRGYGDLTPEGIRDLLLAAMNENPPGVNVKKVNDITIQGAGVPGNSMRPL